MAAGRARATIPLADLLLADFMVVDVSKPYAMDSYLEIERNLLKGSAHQTFGGRSLDDDCMDTFLTFMVNAGNGLGSVTASTNRPSEPLTPFRILRRQTQIPRCPSLTAVAPAADGLR